MLVPLHLDLGQILDEALHFLLHLPVRRQDLLLALGLWRSGGRHDDSLSYLQLLSGVVAAMISATVAIIRALCCNA